MAAKAFIASLSHPSELFALIKFKLLNEADLPAQQPPKDSPTYSLDTCYYMLHLTSRSFARVIQELDPELKLPICLFYLILRGLDTIEDDMTIPLDKKTDNLVRFHTFIQTPGWVFLENGKDEKDAVLLQQFDSIIEQFLTLRPSYQSCIVDITRRMGNGMAMFCDPEKRVISIQDYGLYTHYVAGLVGIGLTNLFVASGLESESIQKYALLPTEENPTITGFGSKGGHDLANRMGLFLQKVNILKDYLQDLEEGRIFWPEDIWRQYSPCPLTDDISVFARPENLSRGVALLNHLCADALELVPDCLEYLSTLKTPSIFKFCAIPQVMALATIDLFFNNPALFQSNGTKIRRGLAVKLILSSGDIESVKRVYQHYILHIHRLNHSAVNKYNPHNKSFIKISSALGKIQQWINEHSIEVSNMNSRVGEKPFLLEQENQKYSHLFWILVLISVLIYLGFFSPTLNYI